MPLCICLAGCQQEPDPNFVFLVVDALRFDHVGTLGYGKDTTPTLDDLAARGITFTDNTSPSSYTRASVPSILTSVFPSVHGLLRQGQDVEVLSDRFETLAELLGGRGYATAAFMPNPALKEKFNLGQGFDLYDDNLLFQGPDKTRRGKFETANKIHRRALAWLDSTRPDRFFLYLHYRDVHGPYLPPPAYADMFWDEDGDKRKLEAREYQVLPNYLRLEHDHGVLEHYVAQYDAEIRYTDDRIGDFLSELEARGLLENTVIVVTSDHGESFLEHGKWNHGSGLYQEEIHTPLLLVLPDSELAGRQVALPVQTLDLYPTILDILHLPKSPGLQGTSLFEAIEGRASPERPIFSEGRFPGNRREGAVRVGRWKLIYDPDERKAELYDLQDDPGEQRNLAGSAPQRVEDLTRRLESFWQRAAQLAPPASGTSENLDAETVGALRALGYID